MTNERCEQLYTLFKALGKNLVMDKFEDRLEVQKISYIAQSYGINLDYPFFWYLRGPYSKLVTADGYAIHEMINKGKELTIQKNFENDKVKKFRDIIKQHMNDSLWLEIAASIIYLKNEQYKEEPLDQIIGYLMDDMTCGYKSFPEDLVRGVLIDLIKTGLLK